MKRSRKYEEIMNYRWIASCVAMTGPDDRSRPREYHIEKLYPLDRATLSDHRYSPK